MKDQGTLNPAWLTRASPPRSQSKCWRHHERLHPYRREVLPAYHLTTTGAYSNGSSPGQTATLSNGAVSGKRSRESSSNDTAVMDLMDQVAQGNMEPSMAATYLQQMMNTSEVMNKIRVEDKSWGEENMPSEIVWAPGKSSSQLVIALQRVIQTGVAALAVRIPPQVAEEVAKLLPNTKHNEIARTLHIAPGPGAKNVQRLPGTVAIISDTSAEERVLQEAIQALQIQGCYAYKLASSGGPDSLPNLSAADSASVVVVVAEGSGYLPRVVASSISPPVVVVPTNESTVTNSPGLTHVDANNGLAAALIAARILRTVAKMQRPSKA